METWKAIAGYEGIYEVSDQGRVRSMWYGKWKILKPEKTRNGYLQVKLCKDDYKKNRFVHRLVACAFIPNPLGLDTVNHRDGVKTNNVSSNLEWMRREDNIAYSQPRWAERKVQMFDKSTGELLATFPSMMEAMRGTGIAPESICRCCNGKRKSAGGYVWRYKK